MEPTPAPALTLSFASLLVTDIVRQAEYYRELFALPEVVELESPHFRGLRIGGTILGFSGPHARELLALPGPAERGPETTYSFLTFETDRREEVDRLTLEAERLGGTVRKPPGETYYGAWQSVVADPEGHVFRINHLPGV